MTPKERAERIAHWGWAAVTLGVEALPDRIMGLVDTTAEIPIERLRAALELAIKAEVKGYLPSPGAVMAAWKSLATHQPRQRTAPRELTPEQRAKLDRELNPQGWNDDQKRAFLWRMSNDPGYAERVKISFAQRHAWAAAEYDRLVDNRRTAAGFKIDLRRQLNLEAFDHFPRPDPLADGWTMPAGAVDVVGALTGGMQMPSGKRARGSLAPEQPGQPNDSKGLEAARAAAKGQQAAQRLADEALRGWS